jgi:hypothetical protein
VVESGRDGGDVWIGWELGLGLSALGEPGGEGEVGSGSGRYSGSGSGSGASSRSDGVGVSIGSVESRLGFGSGGMEIASMEEDERGKEVISYKLGRDNPAEGSSRWKKVIGARCLCFWVKLMD